MVINSGVIYDVRHHSTGSEVDFKRRYRVGGALSILALWQATPVRPEHKDTCERFPAKLERVSFGYRERVCCTCYADSQPWIFPEWVTDEVIMAAYEAADTLQTASGAYRQREAGRLHEEAVRAKGQ